MQHTRVFFKISTTIVLLSLVAACVPSPYSKFYIDRTNGRNTPTNTEYAISGTKPTHIKGDNLQKDVDKMLEDGYVMVGHAAFNGKKATNTEAISHARKVSASVVITYAEYSNTVSSNLPLTLPNRTTSQTSIYGNTFGSGGYNSFNAYANTTTYGSQTTFIPIQEDRYFQVATFWRKLKNPGIGIHAEDLTPESHRIINTNKGIYVRAVIKNTPAYYADVFKGDVILEVNNKDVYDTSSFEQSIKKPETGTTQLLILRNGEQITKDIPRGFSIN